MADELDGIDSDQAAIIKEAVAEAFKLFERGHPIKSPPVLAVSEHEIRRIVREEVEKAMVPVLKRIEGFVESGEINKRISDAIHAGFQSIGLPIDKDHLEETGSRMRGVIETQKLIDQTWRTVRMALILAAVGAVLSLLGVHLPLGGVEGH